MPAHCVAARLSPTQTRSTCHACRPQVPCAAADGEGAGGGDVRVQPVRHLLLRRQGPPPGARVRLSHALPRRCWLLQKPSALVPNLQILFQSKIGARTDSAWRTLVLSAALFHSQPASSHPYVPGVQHEFPTPLRPLHVNLLIQQATTGRARRRTCCWASRRRRGRPASAPARAPAPRPPPPTAAARR